MVTKKIFIGGTGRSGTTILSSWLGSHSEIQKMPLETRFIVDKNGLIDLYQALTKDYSTEQARIAISSFHTLMLKEMVTPRKAPYIGYNFKKLFGENHYKSTFDHFFSQLHYGQYIASDFHSTEKYIILDYLRIVKAFVNKYIHRISNLTNIRTPNFLQPNWPKEAMYLGKYFNDSTDLEYLIENFVNELFQSYSNNHNKLHWCEDTPANALHINFLSTIFKDGYFIHIVRNPLGVAYSYKNQFWGPNNYAQIVSLLSSLYEKLIEMKNYALNNNVSFLEIKLEELNKIEKQEEIIDFLKINNSFDGSISFSEEKVNYYRELIPKSDFEYLSQHLKKYIEYYNYHD